MVETSTAASHALTQETGRLAEQVGQNILVHAVMLVDQAGWHLSRKLVEPKTITIMPIPAKCPELNPTENLWEFVPANWLSTRVDKA